MTLCVACCEATAAFNACMWCGYRIRAPGTRAARNDIVTDVAARLDELTNTAKQATTLKRHNAEMQAYMDFCSAKLDMAVGQTTPLHVLAYLMACDSNGHTVVHNPDCPQARATTGGAGTAECSGVCPTRLKASSVRTKVAALRAAFEEQGCSVDWGGGHSPSENPCSARAIDVYVSGVAKEQLHAGVPTRLAPLFDRDVFIAAVNAMLRLRDTALEGGDYESAWWYLQGATMLSLMFFYPDRSHNVAELKWGDIEQIAACTLRDGTKRAAHVSITIRLSKSVAATMQERHALVPDVGPGAPYSPVLLLHQLHATVCQIISATPKELAIMHVFVPQGHSSRRASKLPQAAHTCISTQAMQQVVTTAMTHAGMGDTDITLHSFRASGAKDALARGMPVDEILEQYHWRSPDMLEYYTQLRRLWTKDGATRDTSTWPLPAPGTPGGASGQATTEPNTGNSEQPTLPGSTVGNIPSTVAEGQQRWAPVQPLRGGRAGPPRRAQDTPTPTERAHIRRSSRLAALRATADTAVDSEEPPLDVAAPDVVSAVPAATGSAAPSGCADAQGTPAHDVSTVPPTPTLAPAVQGAQPDATAVMPAHPEPTVPRCTVATTGSGTVTAATAAGGIQGGCPQPPPFRSFNLCWQRKQADDAGAIASAGAHPPRTTGDGASFPAGVVDTPPAAPLPSFRLNWRTQSSCESDGDGAGLRAGPQWGARAQQTIIRAWAIRPPSVAAASPPIDLTLDDVVAPGGAPLAQPGPRQPEHRD